MNISSHNFSIHLNSTFNAPKAVSDHSSEIKQETSNAFNKDENNGLQKADKKETTVNFLGSTQKVESELSQQEIDKLRELSQRDREVRAHEQAHAAVAGSLAKGGPSYSFERGPDGQLYAVGGEVQIDTSAVAGDPQATAEKARQVRRAALAPAQPSRQDRAIAAAASALEAQARVEIAQQKTEDGVELLNAQFSNESKSNEVEKGQAMEETINSEVHSKCAQCGGQHSAESHSVAISLGETFNTGEEKGKSESLLDTTI